MMPRSPIAHFSIARLGRITLTAILSLTALAPPSLARAAAGTLAIDRQTDPDTGVTAGPIWLLAQGSEPTFPREQIPEPALEPTLESTPEPTPEPALELSPELSPELTPELSPELTLEPTPEPTLETTPEPTPAASLDPTAEPSPSPDRVTPSPSIAAPSPPPGEIAPITPIPGSTVTPFPSTPAAPGVPSPVDTPIDSPIANPPRSRGFGFLGILGLLIAAGLYYGHRRSVARSNAAIETWLSHLEVRAAQSPPRRVPNRPVSAITVAGDRPLPPPALALRLRVQPGVSHQRLRVTGSLGQTSLVQTSLVQRSQPPAAPPA